MTVAVIIPTYLRPKFLTDCVDSVFQSSVVPDHLYISCRVNDSSTIEAVLQLCQKYSHKAPIILVPVHERGHIPPVEEALKKINDEITVILDDDTTVTEHWLSELTRPFSDNNVGAVGGRVVDPGVSEPILKGQPGCISFYGKLWGNIGWVQSDNLIEVDTIMEGNSAWRTDLLKSVSVYQMLRQDDSTYYGLDLTLKIKKLGKKIIYNAKALIYHYSAPREVTINRNDALRLYHGLRNYTYIYLNHAPPMKRIAYILWTFLVGDRLHLGLSSIGYLFLSGDKKFRSNIKYTLKGRLKGIQAFLGNKEKSVVNSGSPATR